MRFDYIIGNPPYQATIDGSSDKAIYDLFMLSAYKLARRTILITPARFLFAAGRISSDFINFILYDKHFKVTNYIPNANDIFSNTTFLGGVAIHLYDTSAKYNPIEVFTSFNELNSILYKVKKDKPLTSIIHGQTKFHLATLYKDFPELKSRVGSNGKEKRLTSNCMSFPCFHDSKEKTDVRVFGRDGNKRTYKYIDKKYITPSTDIYKYKVIVPASNGSNVIGRGGGGNHSDWEANYRRNCRWLYTNFYRHWCI